MATKKVSSAKVSSKKEVKKKNQVRVQNTEQSVILNIKLISYTVEAIIPTMMYGNITPKITVEAGSMEDAKRAVMPHIEELYRTYAQIPLDGRLPAFFQKASVVVEERKVDPEVIKSPKTSEPDPLSKPDAKAKDTSDSVAEPLGEKTQAYIKAESAITNAMSKEALHVISDQLSKSIKLSDIEKSALTDLLLKKMKEF